MEAYDDGDGDHCVPGVSWATGCHGTALNR